MTREQEIIEFCREPKIIHDIMRHFKFTYATAWTYMSKLHSLGKINYVKSLEKKNVSNAFINESLNKIKMRFTQFVSV